MTELEYLIWYWYDARMKWFGNYIWLLFTSLCVAHRSHSVFWCDIFIHSSFWLPKKYSSLTDQTKSEISFNWLIMHHLIEMVQYKNARIHSTRCDSFIHSFIISQLLKIMGIVVMNSCLVIICDRICVCERDSYQNRINSSAHISGVANKNSFGTLYKTLDNMLKNGNVKVTPIFF